MKHVITFVTAVLLPATPALSANDTVCKSIADAIGTLGTAPYDRSSDQVDAPIQRIAAEHGSMILLDQSPVLTGGAKTLDTELRNRFHASAAVLKAVRALDPAEGFSIWLRRLGGTSVYAVEVVSGTAGCEDFAFFDAPPSQSAKLAPGPPQLEAARRSGNAFCETGEGLLGQVDSTPVFIDQGWDPIEPTYRIVVSAWLGGAWAKPCTLQVVLQSSYRVAGIDCHGAVCAQLPATAVAIAQAREAQIQHDSVGGNPPDTFAWGASPSAAARAEVEQINGLLGQPRALDSMSVASASQHGFGDDAVVFPVVLGGQSYAAVLGHGSVGWRVYPDFLLALYDLKAGQAELVASVDIAREVGPAQSIKIAP